MNLPVFSSNEVAFFDGGFNNRVLMLSVINLVIFLRISMKMPKNEEKLINILFFNTSLSGIRWLLSSRIQQYRQFGRKIQWDLGFSLVNESTFTPYVADTQ